MLNIKSLIMLHHQKHLPWCTLAPPKTPPKFCLDPPPPPPKNEIPDKNFSKGGVEILSWPITTLPGGGGFLEPSTSTPS